MHFLKASFDDSFWKKTTLYLGVAISMQTKLSLKNYYKVLLVFSPDFL